MNEREGFQAQQEAKHEVAGTVSRSTRELMWSGLTKYLAAEAQHARKAAISDKRGGEQPSHW